MKKALLFLLVVCMAFGCFVACGEEEKTPATATKAPATATVAPTEEATEEAQPTEEATEEVVPTEEATDEAVEPTDGEEPTDEVDDPNAALDCVSFDFRGGEDAWLNYEGGYAYLAESGNQNCTQEGGDGCLTIVAEAADPYFYFYNFEEFYLPDYPIFQISIKNGTPKEVFEMFLFAMGDQLTGTEVIQQGGLTANSSEYQTFIIDLTAEGTYNALESIDKYVSAVRIDCVSTEPSEDVSTWSSIDIEYFGFFKTLEDAQAWQ